MLNNNHPHAGTDCWDNRCLLESNKMNILYEIIKQTLQFMIDFILAYQWRVYMCSPSKMSKIFLNFFLICLIFFVFLTFPQNILKICTHFDYSTGWLAIRWKSSSEHQICTIEDSRTADMLISFMFTCIKLVICQSSQLHNTQRTQQLSCRQIKRKGPCQQLLKLLPLKSATDVKMQSLMFYHRRSFSLHEYKTWRIFYAFKNRRNYVYTTILTNLWSFLYHGDYTIF